MVAALYKSLGKTAKALLTKYGKPYTYKRITNSAYNTATGAVTKTTTTYTIKGQAFDYSVNEIDRSGGLIKTGDMKVYAPAVMLPFDPNSATDKITIAGIDWSIINSNKVVDEQVLLILQVRRV